jgi:hypothetical protein
MTNDEFKPKSLKKIAPSGKVTISGRDEALENIQAYYEDDTGTVILPPHQEDIRMRWESIHALILKGESLGNIIRKMSKMWDVSESTIRRDLPCVEKIFNSQTLSYSMRRQRASNIALRIYKKSEKAEDLSNMNRALTNLIKADGLEQEPLDMPKMEPHIYIIMPDPTTEALLRRSFPIVDGHINLNDITQNTEDAEFTEIPPTDA